MELTLKKVNIRRVLFNKYVVLFINGFLLATLIYSRMEDNYEKGLFKGMADYVKSKAGTSAHNEETLLLQSLHLTYYLGQTRSGIFDNKDISVVKSSIDPLAYDLMTFKGACASYACILSRLLNELHIPNRIAQMKVNGLYGGHILVEAKTAKGWVVLDGVYDLYFRRSDGSLASFADVQQHWDIYQQQVPSNYNKTYRYEGVRYTNWNKIPVLMPLIKNICYLILGKKSTENFSIRPQLLSKYHIFFQLIIGVFLLETLVITRIYLHKRRSITVNSHGSLHIEDRHVTAFESKIDRA